MSLKTTSLAVVLMYPVRIFVVNEIYLEGSI